MTDRAPSSRGAPDFDPGGRGDPEVVERRPELLSNGPRHGLVSPRMKRPYAYIVASSRNGTLYVGVTSDIGRRAFEHRAGALPGFTRRYSCKFLVWMEAHERMNGAIAREKQIKSGSRKDKLALIERDNPLWRDLFDTLNM